MTTKCSNCKTAKAEWKCKHCESHVFCSQNCAIDMKAEHALSCPEIIGKAYSAMTDFELEMTYNQLLTQYGSARGPAAQYYWDEILKLQNVMRSRGFDIANELGNDGGQFLIDIPGQ